MADNRLLISENSTIAWYYNWAAWPTRTIGDAIPFMPLIHGLDDASSPALPGLLNTLSLKSTHLLTFNEPDGDTESGGSAISPEDAARSYLSDLVRFRNGPGRTWQLSHPVVTGSGRGLDWLRAFNESCYELNARVGCPADFVAVHWYGDFGGLAAWLGTLREFYGPDLSMWITEMALPQASTEVTMEMMNQSIRYLDGLDYVDGYAWFGAFRSDEANEWTGDGVSLFDGDGGLTELGALYLGGEQRGFSVGMRGPGSGASGIRAPLVAAMFAVGVTIVISMS